MTEGRARATVYGKRISIEGEKRISKGRGEDVEETYTLNVYVLSIYKGEEGREKRRTREAKGVGDKGTKDV